MVESAGGESHDDHVSLARERLTRRRLAEFCRKFASHERTLVVHCVDLDHKRFFPNSVVMSSRSSRTGEALPDIRTDTHYGGLAKIPDAGFNLIVCTGLLEHVPDPQAIVGQFHRIVRPGGRLIVSASAVFPFHGAPDNYFHFTPNGFRHLFRDWTRVERLEGSTRPFETIAVLLQRINMQCDVVQPARIAIEMLRRLAPVMDVFVRRQYQSNRVRNEQTRTDAFMPATLQAVVVR